jgi:hypothetical protein
VKTGERIEIERLPTGFYKVTQTNGTIIIGEAASTAIALTNAVFREEAQGDLTEAKVVSPPKFFDIQKYFELKAKALGLSGTLILSGGDFFYAIDNGAKVEKILLSGLEVMQNSAMENIRNLMDARLDVALQSLQS